MTHVAPETAREHINNALAILGVYRERIERGNWADSPRVVAHTIRDVESRLHRAVQEIERGNV